MPVDAIGSNTGMTFSSMAQNTVGMAKIGASMGGSGMGMGVSASSAASMDPTVGGAMVVSQTLNNMNSGPMGSASDMSTSFNFQKDVLGSFLSGRGTIMDMMG